MKKIIIINGLIAGAIVSSMFLITHPLFDKGILNYDNGMIIGYTSMVIGLSLVFVGIKTYRDQHQKGVITFGKGVQIGLLITLVASIVYALCWEVSFNTFASDYTEKYTQHYVDKMKREGASETEITQMRTEMAEFNEYYKNPIIRFGVTIMEIAPVGIVITLISAALLRRKEFLSAT
ncbi:MAG TPA: DUF4199 domain-containing protein [Ohtaekwangia sp.]|uniref:DUF4199 domain-containing protein n=1 Tax=Ohtaekwangia sp. TaxID=2066019 RepID=UPI002F93F157